MRQTRQALRLLDRPAGQGEPARQATARALSLVDGLCRSNPGPENLAQLTGLCQDLQAQGWPAAWPLGSSLMHFMPHWQEHQAGRVCA